MAKPTNAQESLDILRHMVPGKEVAPTDPNKSKRAQLKATLKKKQKEDAENTHLNINKTSNLGLNDDNVSVQNSTHKTRQNIERQNILDAKRAVIKEVKQETTLSQLRKEMMGDTKV